MSGDISILFAYKLLFEVDIFCQPWVSGAIIVLGSPDTWFVARWLWRVALLENPRLRPIGTGGNTRLRVIHVDLGNNKGEAASEQRPLLPEPIHNNMKPRIPAVIANPVSKPKKPNRIWKKETVGMIK